MAHAGLAPTAALRRALADGVRAVFHDRAAQSAPIVRSTGALFAPDSVIWRVHGDVTTMMVGGISALLMQMLHPAALAGIWDHSTFRGDMLGRLRRTARFIAMTTYANEADALAAVARVRDVHARVTGTMPDGTAYGANDPRLLAWVHVTEATSFLDAWIRYGEPDMSLADQDAYFAQFAAIARLLGADPVPSTRAQAVALIAQMRPELRADERTREVARLVLHQRPYTLAAAPVQAMIMAAAVDILPRWASDMHGLGVVRLSRPIARLSTTMIAQTIRWAFAS
ncbi:oxygenase MpaB family protein [Novosphingobium sp.]|uniref:oxygenase MpaB family protein n=1 Tax=Novosphingobium sp. TaxID=1874826 RepID=UPI003D121A9C